MWIANEDFNGVVVVDLETGVGTNVVFIESPIGLHYDEIRDVVYVSSKQKHRHGGVYAVDRKTLRIVQEFREDRMEHPTGMVVYDNILYVAEQIESAILSFDIKSGKFIEKITKHIPGDLEQLILTYC